MMKPMQGLLAACIVLAVALGCASTKVSDRQVRDPQTIPRPNQILVYDFGASPDDVPGHSGLAGHYDEQQVPTPEQLAEGRKLGAEVARALADELDKLGLPGRHAADDAVPQIDDLVLRGYFVSIDEGSTAKRMVIGFGSGSSQLKTYVEGFQMTAQGLRKLGSGSVESGGGKAPGAVLPAALAVATANPIGLVVMTAVKTAGEVSGSSTIEGRARQTAKAISKELEPRFQQQGWIE
jgi:hypothetical protein